MRKRGDMRASIGWKSVCVFLVLLPWLNQMLEAKSYAYVMPAEQIMQFMTANFSKFQTMVIHQSTRVEDLEGNEERVFEEIITMKSPDLFHSEVIGPIADDTLLRDHSYRQMFLANSASRLLDVLYGMGIWLPKTGYTRIDGIIAYQIGDNHEDSPKLLVEKARFLPLLILYKSPSHPEGDLIKVRFLDYRKVQQGWLPFEMTYSYGQKIIETYTINSVKVNVPVSQSLFDPSTVLLPGSPVLRSSATAEGGEARGSRRVDSPE
jgi:hypothetical protein